MIDSIGQLIVETATPVRPTPSSPQLPMDIFIRWADMRDVDCPAHSAGLQGHIFYISNL